MRHQQIENKVPLMIVSSVATLKMLIQYGGNINLQDDIGDTPLIFIIKNWPEIEMAYAMIKAGANVHIRNNEGESALSTAIQRKNALNISTEEGQYLENLYNAIINLLQKSGAK